MAGRANAGLPVSSPRSARRRNAWSLRVTFDVEQMVRLMRSMKSAGSNIRPALVAAHKNMAHFLQADVIRELEDAIERRGRIQRGDALVEALGAEKTIAVDESGFTFGFLENAPGHVRLYAQNLEEGTDVHRGTELWGFFTEGGEFVGPNDERTMQIDPRMVQVARDDRSRPWGDPLRGGGGNPVNSKGKGPATVEHDIEGYHYFARGMEAWREGFYEGRDWEDSVLAIYNGALKAYGVDIFDVFFRKYGTVPPGAGQYSLRTQMDRATTRSDRQWIEM